MIKIEPLARKKNDELIKKKLSFLFSLLAKKKKLNLYKNDKKR